MIRVQFENLSYCSGGAEGSGQAGSVKSSLLDTMAQSYPDAEHRFARAHKGSQEIFSARFGLFSRGQKRRHDGRARMNSGARLAHVIELEAVRHGPIGQRGGGGRRFEIGSENRACPATGLILRESLENFAPWLRRPVESDGDAI